MVTTREHLEHLEDLVQAFDNSGGSTGQLPLYHGRAQPGTAKTVARWKIIKMTYDANDQVTDIQWASGTSRYDKIWDSRASYVYS